MSFIEEILPHAKKAGKEYNVLVSLILAQAIHESNWGKSGLAKKGFNLFGIKGSYNGQSVNMATGEVYDGRSVTIDANFRKYPSWYESIIDLMNLYKNGVSWDAKKYHAVIGEKDYKKAAKALQAAGYATDPNYASKLIKTIESNKLTQYDSVKEVKTVEPAKTGVKSETVKVNKYVVKKTIPAFVTAADAKAKRNKKGEVKAGTYYVFNESKGMLNVTSKKGVSGSWINPSQNKDDGKKYHIVKSGEVATNIAQKYGITLSKLKNLNPFIKNIDLIYPNQKLRVK